VSCSQLSIVERRVDRVAQSWRWRVLRWRGECCVIKGFGGLRHMHVGGCMRRVHTRGYVVLGDGVGATICVLRAFHKKVMDADARYAH